ncbi:hypothetical protein WR25_19811 [Diploscapter pachys]|uniref:C3H1-type domain-containing protein n=1 Tax=Diploscapter pachys TaxID=2018661 RepID=A0A2A2LAP6_9BILA|nr:hypothetical protein WR25_19811 [Diploscapter pachys]
MASKENKATIEIVLSDSDDGDPRGVEKSETAESAEGEELKVDVESSRSDKEWAAGNGRMEAGEEVKQEPEQERDLEMKLDAAEVDSVGEVKKEELKEDQEWPTNPWANVDLTIKDTYFITDDERMLICGQKTPQNAPSHLYKTVLCRRYMNESHCALGDSCNFAHGVADMRMPMPGKFARRSGLPFKSVICTDFSRTGYCQFGFTCGYIHRITNPAAKKAHEMYIEDREKESAGFSISTSASKSKERLDFTSNHERERDRERARERDRNSRDRDRRHYSPRRYERTAHRYDRGDQRGRDERRRSRSRTREHRYREDIRDRNRSWEKDRDRERRTDRHRYDASYSTSNRSYSSLSNSRSNLSTHSHEEMPASVLSGQICKQIHNVVFALAASIKCDQVAESSTNFVDRAIASMTGSAHYNYVPTSDAYIIPHSSSSSVVDSNENRAVPNSSTFRLFK